MINVKVLFFIFLFIHSTARGQTTPDYIQPRDGVYFYKGEKVRARHLGSIIKDDPEAVQIYKQYQRQVRKGNRRSMIGLCLISLTGWYIHSTELSTEVSGFYARIIGGSGGVGLVLLMGGPATVYTKKKKYLKAAVRTYNENLRDEVEIGYQPSIRLDFGTTPSGIGFTLRF
ncbi:MAG: hypothetical protein AAF573_01290 [Bacteroidota bacterium]